MPFRPDLYVWSVWIDAVASFMVHLCIGWMNRKWPAGQFLIEPRLLYRSV